VSHFRGWFLALPLVLCACGGPAAGRAVAAPSPSPVAVTTPAPTPVPVPSRPPSGPQPVSGSASQIDLTNRARAARGLQPLASNPCLVAVAAAHAKEMASAGRIFHGDGVQQDMSCRLGSRQTGENVGETSGGADDERVFDAFMNSSGHRANILGGYRYIGVAWVVGARGTGYISVEFG